MNETASAAWIWDREHFAPCAAVPLSDRGFRYGMSFFESLRVTAAGPQFLAEHLQRLRTACRAHDFRIDDRALAAAGETLHRAEFAGFARIYVTAGDGPVTAPADACRCFLFLETRAPAQPAAYDLALADEPHQPLFGGLKTANYWSNIGAFKNARARGCHEALLFNTSGELISASLANVFVVHEGIVKTPALTCGARAGVIREQVMQHIAVRECSLFFQQVMEAEEIFLSNSWIGIHPAASVAGRKLPSRSIAEKLAGELATRG